MRKRLQGLAIGLIIGALLTSGIVFGENLSKKAELFYNNIKIYIDGAEIVPKDANGNIVEPFIMDGTTYLPVRAISNAFEKDVEWDGETQSVYIGKEDHTKPDNYLSRMDDYKLEMGHSHSKLSIVNDNGNIIDFNNNTYKKGLLFVGGNWFGKIDNDSDEAHFMISYPLNSQYSELYGKIVLPKEFETCDISKRKGEITITDVLFYGDGKIICEKNGVTPSMPVSFDIPLKGVNQLTIKIRLSNTSGSDVALTDLALYK